LRDRKRELEARDERRLKTVLDTVELAGLMARTSRARGEA